MATAPTMRATFDELFEDRFPYLSNVSWLSFMEHADEYSVVGNIQNSDQYQETDFQVAELGQFQQKLEGAPIEVDSIMPSYSKHFIHVTWAKGVEVTMEAIEDDKDGIMTDMAAALGYSARQTVEYLAANAWFNNGFTTETAMDGVAVYGSHTTASGDTISNTFSLDLGVGGLRAMLVHFAKLVSERGNKINGMMANLVVPPELEFTARELVNSALRPDSDTNADNTFKKFNLNVIVSHYLNSDTAWFGWGAPDRIKAKWYWRKRPTPVADTRYSNQSALSGLLFRQSVGVSDYRLLAGSTPS